MKEIGNKISRLRKNAGYTQKIFAEIIGVSQPSLIKFEKGETEIIPIGIAIKISSELDVPFNELFEIESNNAVSRLIEIKYNHLLKDYDLLKDRLREKDQLIKLLVNENTRLKKSDISRFFNNEFDEIDSIQKSIDNCDSDEEKEKELIRKQSIISVIQHRILTLKAKDILSEMELFEILFQKDPHIVEIVDSGGDIISQLTEYWSNFMNVNKSKVQEFLYWHERQGSGSGGYDLSV